MNKSSPTGRLTFPSLPARQPRQERYTLDANIDFAKLEVRAMAHFLMPVPGTQQLVKLEEAMADWRRVVCTAQPTANADYVRTVCEEIVRRAKMLADTNPIRFEEVAAFFLTRSRAWVLGGMPVNQIGHKLPKTLGDLGMMKIAEGGQNGEPLSVEDLKQALARPKHRTMQ